MSGALFTSDDLVITNGDAKVNKCNDGNDEDDNASESETFWTLHCTSKLCTSRDFNDFPSFFRAKLNPLPKIPFFRQN